MSDVKIFDLDGTVIDVKDETARQTANAASAQSNINAQDIADLKALARLTVSYNASTEKITFTTTTH